MRPRLEKIAPEAGRSFRLTSFRVKRFDAPWHFHPQIELTLIVSSSGRRFVGDSVESFKAGDLVLLGPNVPHFWHNEQVNSKAPAQAIVVQFDLLFLGEQFMALPEAAAIARLFERARRGLHFSGAGAAEAAKSLHALLSAKGTASLVGLLSTLAKLAAAKARPLISEWYRPKLNPRSEQRLARVYAYLNRKFSEPVELAAVARVAAMTPEGFSRYFKRAVGENFSVTLNRIRVDEAARLLTESETRVADIALATGFPTLSNFNRRFLEIKRRTPRDFRKRAHRNLAKLESAALHPESHATA